MNKLAFAAASALATFATSSAFAGMSMQGPQLTGVELQSLRSNQPVVAVRLPSGEIFDLHRRVAH
ncbi:MAG TPA: hypothetical protein VGF07_01575 [Stellaceae bacterium]|jgi:hypothetical protein